MLVFLCVFFTVISLTMYLVYGIKNNFKKNVKYTYENEEKKDNDKLEEKQIIEYKANQTIRVKMTKQNNEIIAMDINDYLRGVLASEMPAYYDIEALKAQAVVARTYTYNKIEQCSDGENADICDSFNHCQAFYPKEKILQIWTRRGDDENLKKEYWDKINTAVVETQNKVITYKRRVYKSFLSRK